MHTCVPLAGNGAVRASHLLPLCVSVPSAFTIPGPSTTTSSLAPPVYAPMVRAPAGREDHAGRWADLVFTRVRRGAALSWRRTCTRPTRSKAVTVRLAQETASPGTPASLPGVGYWSAADPRQ